MPYYLYRGRFTRESIRALIDKPQDRTEAARKIIEAGGGKLHNYLFSFGDRDVVVLCEYPDNTSAAAVAMAVGCAGTLEDSETTVLLSMKEAVAAMKKGKKLLGGYRPPQG